MVKVRVLLCAILLKCIGFYISSGKVCKTHIFQHTLKNVAPKTSLHIQADAAKQLSHRLLGKFSNRFSMSVDSSLGHTGKDAFKLSKHADGIITIVGTSGVAASWGLHYYLKNFCNAHISWDGLQLELPNTLPGVELVISANDRYRYYQNVCTAGYSTVWWKWAHWEKHIDWMALNGINLALAFLGQEAIWERVYLEMNLTTDEINQQFAGPAFLPWSRMGNLRGWGGPLSSSWHAHTISLQHRILGRMRDLGMTTVLPAFAGHVPRAFVERFPYAVMTKVGVWNMFEDRYCCPYMLEPTDPLFQLIGTTYLRKYIEEFGTDHIYNCDAFNENEPNRTDLQYLKNLGVAIFKAMNSVDEDAVWLMQGWLFYHDILYWTEARVEAFITSVPIGRMIILDLQSEQFPQYGRLKSYFGQPFIWCMLHNFGGTLGMFGSAQIINQRVFDGRNFNGSSMIGIGLTPEGINQNYVIYELMMEMGYRREPANLKVWFENYATRSYGAWNEYTVTAWKKLANTIYSFSGPQRIRGHYVITRRPSLQIDIWTWYDHEIVLSAWDMLLMARYGRSNCSLYRHDIVDVTRQALQMTADRVYLKILEAYKNENIAELQEQTVKMMEIFDDLERILASSENFLLGTWLEDAKALGINQMERDNYEYNARNQITLWGPNGEIRDYANKQWSGVILDYFKPRWEMFLNQLYHSLENRQKFNQSECNQKIFDEVEKPFTFSNKIYPTEPIGNCIDVATQIHAKWRDSNKKRKIQKSCDKN